MLPYGLHAVGNGVSLLPCRRMTGVCVIGPAAPKPITGAARDVSSITGKPDGKLLPTTPAACAPATAKNAATAAACRIQYFIIVISSVRIGIPTCGGVFNA